MEEIMNIAQKLISLRKEQNLTQENMANIIGVSLTAIRNYENIDNPRIPKNEILIKMANFFNVDLEYLLNDNINNKTHKNIIIGKELQLEDSSIKVLKNFQNENITESLNYFINDELFYLLVYSYNFLLQLEVYRQQLFSFVGYYFEYDKDTKKINIHKQKNIIIWEYKDIISFLKQYEKKITSLYNFLTYANELYPLTVPYFFSVITQSGNYKNKIDKFNDVLYSIYNMNIESINYETLFNKLIELDNLHGDIFDEILTLHTLTKNSLIEYANDICKFDNLYFYDKDFNNITQKIIEKYLDKDNIQKEIYKINIKYKDKQ